jgi:predicted aldo/keto reductase-like oxidoreductase
MGFGAAQLGNLFRRTISDEEAATLIKSARDAGVRYFDTAPSYGHGSNATRCGQGLCWYHAMSSFFQPRSDGCSSRTSVPRSTSRCGSMVCVRMAFRLWL